MWASKKRPFVIREICSAMLRPHPEISKGARSLWVTLLGMANAKTGELRHRQHWYDGKDIEKRAEICHVLRKRFIRELINAGYAQMERTRVLRTIKGRMRVVLGESRYWVFKSPRKQNLSSTVNSVNRSRNLPANLLKLHRKSKSQSITEENPRNSVPLDRVVPSTRGSAFSRPEEAESGSLPATDLTVTRPVSRREAPPVVEEKNEPLESRPDLMLKAILSIRSPRRPDPQRAVEMELAVGRAEKIWRARSCPVDPKRLMDSIEEFLTAMANEGCRYPAIFLRRKSELQRGEFTPRTANKSSLGLAKCSKCGDLGWVGAHLGKTISGRCDCEAGQRSARDMTTATERAASQRQVILNLPVGVSAAKGKTFWRTNDEETGGNLRPSGD
jgi:hypothetical protein